MEPTLESSFPAYHRWLPGDHTPFAVMHIVDRVVGRQFLLGTEEKEQFRKLLDQLTAFTGLELLTWTCLDNHYHLLLRVPNQVEAAHLREDLTEEVLFERMKHAFSASYIREVRAKVKGFRDRKQPKIAEQILERLRRQTHDISAFMHMLKRRFSAWYNKKHGRKGTLWEGRFRSTLIEDSSEAVVAAAAYIDLNCVRAGIAKDPKDYRWCGLSEALAGKASSRQGLQTVAAMVLAEESIDWEEASNLFYQWMCDRGREVRSEDGDLVEPGYTAEEIEAIQEAG